MAPFPKLLTVKGREERLAEIFIELADTLVQDFDVTDLFYHLVESCTELIDVDHAGLLLADRTGELQVAATTSEAAHVVELLQLRHEEGPCFDAFRTGNPILVNSTMSQEARERWPSFAEAASEAGIQSIAALPMRLRSQTLGALNLFRAKEGSFSPIEISTGRTLADIASIAILQHQATQNARVVIDQLQGALDSRVVIEQATGVLAERSGLGMDEAFAALRRFARDQNRRLREVAEAVVSHKLDPIEVTTGADRPAQPPPGRL